MCLLQCLVNCEGHYIILSAIRVACPIKANVLYIVRALTKLCIFIKNSVLFEGHYATPLSNHIDTIYKHVPLFVLVP